jgi:ribosome-associated protein
LAISAGTRPEKVRAALVGPWIDFRLQSSVMSAPLIVSPTLTIPAAELRWTSVRASGPGGQNVNKVSSKVELHFDFEGSAVLSAETKARLRALAQSRLDAEGHLVVVSQATRDRQRNLEDARAKLAEIVAHACQRPKRRKATRPPFSAGEARLRDKRHHANRKEHRRSSKGDE